MKHESTSTAEGFRQLDFHEDTFAGMRILPTKSRSDNTGSVVELELLQYAKKETSVLRFLGCANLRVGVDFDVLAHNLPPNTSGVDAHTDKDQMWSLMQSQARDWGVKYAADMSTPLDRKAQVMNDLVCFRVQLCGGVVEIVARRYEVVGPGKPPQLPQNLQRVDKAQKAIDDLLVPNKELFFISSDGKLYGMDSDSKIVLTTNHLVQVLEYGYAVQEYTGQYTIDTNGVISLTLKRYRSSWPKMALWVSGASYYLHPVSGRSGFSMGDRAGATQTPDMKPFWPFKLVGQSSREPKRE